MTDTDGPSMLPRYTACLPCRKRKLKCSGSQPECSRCRATNRKCEYQTDRFKSKTRVLQDQIREMEAKIKAIEGQSSSLTVSTRSRQIQYLGVRSLLMHNSVPPGSRLDKDVLSQLGSLPSDYLPQSPKLGLSAWASPTELKLPPGTVQKLLEVFIARRSHAGFELHMGKILRGMQPGSTEPVASSLVYAMLLIACHFVHDPSLKSWENMLLALTRREIEVNIASAHGDGKGKYNRLHHFQAMLMLGQYFYFKCRLLEGYVHISQATRFAIALGIHRLDSYDLYRYRAPEMLGHTLGVERWSPRSKVELGEGVNTWWACAIRDLTGSMMNGLPLSLSLDEITTVWPRSLSDFESNRDLPDRDCSVASLLDPNMSYWAAESSQDTAGCIKAKACVLIHTATALDNERITSSEITEDWWSRFEECDKTIQRFMQTVPSPEMGSDLPEASALAQVYGGVECGIIALHSALADHESFLATWDKTQRSQPDFSLNRRSYERCVDACRNISLEALRIERFDMSYVHMITGVNWVYAGLFLAKNIPRLRHNGQIEEAREMQMQMTILEKAMSKLVVEYPLMIPQANQLQGMITW